jgi:hypothetical protein
MIEQPSKNEWPEYSLIRFVLATPDHNENGVVSWNEGDAAEIEQAMNNWKARHEQDKAIMADLLAASRDVVTILDYGATGGKPSDAILFEVYHKLKAAIGKAEGES